MAIWNEFIKIVVLDTKQEPILESVSKLIWKIYMYL